jgi:integrase
MPATAPRADGPQSITPTAITKAVKKAAATKTPGHLKDPGQPGLELRIWPGGKRTWSLQCHDAAGRVRRFVLGYHPALGLAAAREACRKLREDVRNGADPIADGKARRDAVQQARDGKNTLRELLGIYARQRGAALRTWPEYRRRIESVFATQLDQPLPELNLQKLQRCVDTWPSAQSAAAATRYLRPIVKWAAHPGRGYVDRDLVLIAQPATGPRRQRVLAAEELTRLLPTLRASASAYAGAMQFILMTLARRSEVARARWSDIDLDAKLWRLPQTKNGREHIIPLSEQAIELLRARRPEIPDLTAFVFLSADEGDGSLPLGNWDRATKIIMRDSGTNGWHRHDLRRSGATLLGNLGVEPHIIEAGLNHVSIHSQLAATYNAARYRPQVADALQRLADRLDIIAAGGAEVRPFKSA